MRKLRITLGFILILVFVPTYFALGKISYIVSWSNQNTRDVLSAKETTDKTPTVARQGDRKYLVIPAGLYGMSLLVICVLQFVAGIILLAVGRRNPIAAVMLIGIAAGWLTIEVYGLATGGQALPLYLSIAGLVAASLLVYSGITLWRPPSGLQG